METTVSLVIVIFSTVLLVYYYLKNKKRSVERFYYKRSVFLFALLQGSCFVVMVSLAFNIRHLIVSYARSVLKKSSR